MLKMLNLFRTAPRIRNQRNLSKLGYTSGDKLHGYVVKRAIEVPEFSMNAIELEHTKTGAKHLHLERDDPNNVFNVFVRTVPKCDTGIAHILEHVVLCGSKKYPVRDPFFKMLDRSMANFMNAMTGSDFTMYPFATQNKKDFQNLLSVYMNAVFFPNINKNDFLQEGWRLEHEVTEDKSTPIIFKGVVFNEMKGYYGNSSYLLSEAIQKLLLPDGTYGCSSGGEPLAIPQLTWQKLKQFHQDHFHPSNTTFMTYGDTPMSEHLEMIDREVMQHFGKTNPNTEIAAQPRWTEPRHATVTCPVDKMATDPDKQAAHSVSYLLSEISDEYDSFVASFVCSLLTDGPSAPMYKSLVESGLGSSYSPMTGYYGRLKEGIFSCGLQGINENDKENVENLIYETIEKTCRQGFPSEQVDALLHQIELSLTHQRSKFGLGLTFSILPVWSHGADPFRSLQVKNILNKFKKNLEEDPDYLKNKLKELFIGNTHRLSLLMVPDEKFNEKIADREEEILNEKIKALSEAEKDQVYTQGLELQKIQNEAEDLSCLPSLNLTDIPRKAIQYQTDRQVIHGKGVYTNIQDTNEVSYFNAILPLGNLPDHLIPYLPLFCSCLTEMGTTLEGYEKFSQRQELFTGGLSASLSLNGHHEDADLHEMAVHLSSHCLDRNVDHMYDMWTDLWQGFSFENENRLKTLLNERAQSLANSLSFSGHSYAMKNAAQSLHINAYYNELCNGITQVDFMKETASKTNINEVIEALTSIANILFGESSSSRFALNITAHNEEKALKSTGNFIGAVAASPSNECLDFGWKQEEIPSSIPSNTENHIDMPFGVNFVSACSKTVPYAHQDNAKLRVLARIMSTKFLHKEIREKGGAYGSGAQQGSDGVWRFFSYRDPNTDKTLETFKKGISWATEGNFTEADVNEAKLAMFQSIDAPVSPSGRGLGYFVSEMPHQVKQNHREQILDATKSEIVEAAQKYLQDTKNIRSTIIGPKKE